MRIGIIGAGLTGLSVAALLLKLGIRAEVFERADGPVDGGSGIYVWPQGVQIMRFLAGDDGLLAVGHGVEYFQTNNRHGEELHQTAVRLADFDFPQPAMMYVRGTLLSGLRALLETDQLSFGKTCVGVDDTGPDVMVRFADGTESRFDLVIGADGIHSAVRNAVDPDNSVVDSGVAAARGLVAFDCPLLRRDLCQIFSFDTSRLVSYPLSPTRDDRYWFLAYPHHHNPLMDREALIRHCSVLRDPLPDFVRRTPEDVILSHPLLDLEQDHEWYYGRVVLVGDSAHGVLPTLGYGYTLGLENGFALVQALLSSKQGDIEGALHRYRRRVADRSREMAQVMRDITRLFYFDGEAAVNTTTLEPIYADFRRLARSTVF